MLAGAIARAEATRSAEVVRVGVESAGPYHRALVARLRPGGHEVVELNPAAVKQSRAQELLRRLKSDARDLGAMAELMVRGAGRCRRCTAALAPQAGWVAHRRRKVAARVALANQVIGQLDLVLPGLDGFSDLLGARAGRVIVTDICDPTACVVREWRACVASWPDEASHYRELGGGGPGRRRVRYDALRRGRP